MQRGGYEQRPERHGIRDPHLRRLVIISLGLVAIVSFAADGEGDARCLLSESLNHVDSSREGRNQSDEAIGWGGGGR